MTTATLRFSWTSSGHWDVVVAPSASTSVEVDLVSLPHYCRFAGFFNATTPPAGAEFSLSAHAS
eukprot:CAMPEP_0203938228 /NCGR_PEP_ID=MMETSP0359-20131031/75308_1 /ASSEMBLY_ACC=CAM_ASM_000338 /TAXON_ID=268821 /ORGANISM="Scrippsiella Hangoei, Strain SHTV-5" /LENGTH=63 /DNA_ID=CAMNT_0050868411 /DNA_START=112 /DNA_END=300 /DNA_ORIENTATION=+